jgi:cytochrome c2
MDFGLSALIRVIRGELFGGYGEAHSSGFRPCLSSVGSPPSDLAGLAPIPAAHKSPAARMNPTNLFRPWRAGRLVLILAAAALAAPAPFARTLDLHTKRSSPFDLAVRGHLAGLAPGEERYITWADLHALPLHSLKLKAEFFPGEQAVTVVFLDDVWQAMPREPGADTVLATCADGYASVYRHDFISQYRPFLILEINGLGPEKWPPAGLDFNPAPYVITVSSEVVPGVATLLDANHKKPWGVTTLEFATFAEAFRDAFSGPWASLSTRAAAGREIWVNSCASCHAGPGAIFGGTKSGQPFAVLQAIAQSKPDFFKLYVHDPKSANPAAKMEAHPHYSDGQLEALIAFVTGERAK